MSLKSKLETLLDAYQDVKEEIRRTDPNLYERWKAGGFLVDNDIVSYYPCLEGIFNDLEDQEDCPYCGENCPNEPEDSEYLCDEFAAGGFNNDE